MRRNGKENKLDRGVLGLLNNCRTKIQSSNNPFIPLGIFTAVFLLLGGCAGYTLGPSNGLAAGDKKIQITPFLNHTYQPRLAMTSPPPCARTFSAMAPIVSPPMETRT